MRKINKIWYVIWLVIGFSIFISGCLFKSGVESKAWFKYASKYDQAWSNFVANAENERFLGYLSEMSKMKQKFLRAKQPTEGEIISVLGSPNRKFQRTGLAAMALKPIEAGQLIDILFKFLQDPNYYFKGYACSARDEFKQFPESRKPELGKKLLEIIKNENEKGKHGIAFQEFSLLSKCPSQDAAQFLSEQFMKEGEENKANRYAAFRTLKKMGDPYYAQAVEYVNNHGSSEVKKEFLNNQNYWKDISSEKK